MESLKTTSITLPSCFSFQLEKGESLLHPPPLSLNFADLPVAYTRNELTQRRYNKVNHKIRKMIMFPLGIALLTHYAQELKFSK